MKNVKYSDSDDGEDGNVYMDVWILIAKIDDIKEMATIKAHNDLPLEKRNEMEPIYFNKIKRAI